jgi:murein DD-endopeptidase MepM/ murein hydrolase activator NlpD
MPTAKVLALKRKSSSTKRKTAQNTVDSPPARTGKGFLWPVRGKIVSAYGGKSEGLKNDGINIAAPRGTQVVAAENGVVAYAGNELRGFGNLLLLKHTGGWITAYAHNERVLVKRGDKIKKGQTIAKVGSSGSVQVPQLHFELRKGKKAINPVKSLRR